MSRYVSCSPVSVRVDFGIWRIPCHISTHSLFFSTPTKMSRAHQPKRTTGSSPAPVVRPPPGGTGPTPPGTLFVKCPFPQSQIQLQPLDGLMFVSHPVGLSDSGFERFIVQSSKNSGRVWHVGSVLLAMASAPTISLKSCRVARHVGFHQDRSKQCRN